MDYNMLEGRVPDFLFNIPSLTELSLRYNNFTELPKSYGNAKSLSNLHLDFNQINQAIPTEIGNLTSLTILSLIGNSLHGSLDPFIALPRIQSLYLSQNNFEGQLPQTINGWNNLISLDLSYNQIQGGIPESLVNLTFLNVLNLTSNALERVFEGDIKLIECRLQVLRLDRNIIKYFPTSFDRCRMLQEIYIDHNMLAGTLPDIFTRMQNLKTLSLSYNKLTGNLPSSLLKKPAINLTLSFNNFNDNADKLSRFMLVNLIESGLCYSKSLFLYLPGSLLC